MPVFDNPLAEPGPAAVMLAGDWHGNTHRACTTIWSAALRGIRAVIQLGDFGYWTPGSGTERYLSAVEEACTTHDVMLLVVDGNHEYFPGLLALPVDPDTGLRQISPHIFHLPRGLRWNWHGFTWMALGGAHSVDRHMRKEGVSWWPQEHLSDDDVVRATAGGPVDVIVSHDAPAGVHIPGLPSDSFPPSQIAAADEHRARVGAVVDATRPALMFHGHYHIRYSAWRGNTHVFGLADDGSSTRDNTLILNLVDGVDISRL